MEKELQNSFEELLKNTSLSGKIQNTLCPNPKEEFPDHKFSKLGTELSIDLNNSDDGTIQINIYADRRGTIVPIDFIDGILIDHCISGETWFYLT